MRPKYSSLHRNLILVSKLKGCIQKIDRNLDQLVLGTLLFAHSLHDGLQSGQSGRTKEPLAEPGAFKRSDHSMTQHFRQCSEAFGLSQVSKM